MSIEQGLRGFGRGQWCVYMLLCGDGSLYTGATNDLLTRLRTHERGQGARYTRGRGPLRLVYREPCGDRSEALRREAALKKSKTGAKRALCAWPLDERRGWPGGDG